MSSDYANVARPVEDDFEMGIETSIETLLSTSIFKEGENVGSQMMGKLQGDNKVSTCICCTGNMYEVIKRQALIG